jgi:hypothetical protein
MSFSEKLVFNIHVSFSRTLKGNGKYFQELKKKKKFKLNCGVRHPFNWI